MKLTKTAYIITVHNKDGDILYLNQYGQFIEKSWMEWLPNHNLPREFKSERAARQHYRHLTKYPNAYDTAAQYPIDCIEMKELQYTAILPE